MISLVLKCTSPRRYPSFASEQHLARRPLFGDINKKRSKFYVGYATFIALVLPISSRNHSSVTTPPIQLKDIDSNECHAMEEVWRRTFRDLLGDGPKYGGDIKECPVLLAEPPLTQKAVREKTTEIMFEQFGVPALYLSMQAVLALYASGRTTGIVLDSGDGVTHAVPISDCYAITPAIIQLDFAGNDLTNFLVGSLESKRNPYITSENGRDIKEKRCRFALNLEEFSSPSEESYDLPDGKRVSIGNERY